MSVSLMFLLHFYIFWDLELNKHKSMWNLLVNYIISKGRLFIVRYVSALQEIINRNQSKYVG